MELKYSWSKFVSFKGGGGGGGGGGSWFLFGIIIFEILVAQNTPTLGLGETFGEIFRPLHQMG